MKARYNARYTCNKKSQTVNQTQSNNYNYM